MTLRAWHGPHRRTRPSAHAPRHKRLDRQARIWAQFQPRVEPLEARAMLSAASVLDTTLATTAITADAVTNATVTGLTPAQVASAYGYNSITLASGIKGTGAGQTIAIIDAYDDPNIASDLKAFDATFGIKDANLTVYKQTVNGQAPATDSGWSMEIALDVEWAHAMAPDANILLVEANTSSLTNLLAAVDYARSQASVSVISMSWGSGEFLQEASYDSHFTTPAGHQGITFVASSGDSGAPAEWPAVSPNVLAVGGTALTVSSTGAYQSETGWSDSGGGTSKYEGLPSYQSTSVTGSTTRSNPDVAYDASPTTGFAVYDTVASSGKTGWFKVGGTSAGAPQWAALVAIADQGRMASGLGTLSNAQTAIYTLSSSDFHDVTSGSNGYSAKAGYDLVTGRGSPIASSVVRDLIAYTGSTSFTISSSSGSSTTIHRPTFPFGGGRYRGFAETGDGGSGDSVAMNLSSATSNSGSSLTSTTAQLSSAALAMAAQPGSELTIRPAAEHELNVTGAGLPIAPATSVGSTEEDSVWEIATSASDETLLAISPARVTEHASSEYRHGSTGGQYRNSSASATEILATNVERMTLQGARVLVLEETLNTYAASNQWVAAAVDDCFRESVAAEVLAGSDEDDNDGSDIECGEIAGWVLETLAVAVVLDRSGLARAATAASELSASSTSLGSRRARGWPVPR